MKETEFKALTYANTYMDANKLSQGLYSCVVPFIYNKQETIESLMERAKQISYIAGADFINDKYFESLSQCALTEITIS